LLVLATVLGLVWAALRFAATLKGILGATGANVISRLLGIVLAAMAVQFVLDGWSAATLPFEEEAAEILTI
jgi:multiple antibiotic resistance protein